MAAVGWLYSGLQVMAPGECASSHRHSASALRFIMEGSGAFTNVDGHRLTLGRNDFVLTPNGTWHEHGVADDGTICIWQDGLDIPLMNALEANFYEVHPDLNQAVAYPVDDTTATWAGSGLRPQGLEWNKRYSPMLKYEWAPTYDALKRLEAASDGSPFDGIIMDYINPTTGGPVMQTIGAQMQLLRPGERTKAHRQVGSFVYQCAKGRGGRSSTGSGSTGRSAIFSSCRPGCTTNMPMRRTATMPACSHFTICRRCARLVCTVKRPLATMAGTSQWLTHKGIS